MTSLREYLQRIEESKAWACKVYRLGEQGSPRKEGTERWREARGVVS